MSSSVEVFRNAGVLFLGRKIFIAFLSTWWVMISSRWILIFTFFSWVFTLSPFLRRLDAKLLLFCHSAVDFLVKIMKVKVFGIESVKRLRRKFLKITRNSQKKGNVKLEFCFIFHQFLKHRDTLKNLKQSQNFSIFIKFFLHFIPLIHICIFLFYVIAIRNIALILSECVAGASLRDEVRSDIAFVNSHNKSFACKSEELMNCCASWYSQIPCRVWM